MDSENTQTGISQALQLLEQLKEAFLSELPEQCNGLSTLTLSLGKQPGNREIYEELYRKVHSMKGSAGTHGVPIISQICHHLEDHLCTVDDGTTQINNRFIDICLSYVDLVQTAADIAQNRHPDFTAVENDLEHIRQEVLEDKRCGLIVESSVMMALMCRDALSKLPVQLSLLDNGLIALERLLQAKFDFLVIGKELKILNGAALISALRASESVNKNIPAIMLTSTRAAKIPPSGRPNHLIQRDMKLAGNLADTVKQVIRDIG